MRLMKDGLQADSESKSTGCCKASSSEHLRPMNVLKSGLAANSTRKSQSLPLRSEDLAREPNTHARRTLNFLQRGRRIVLLIRL